MGKAEVNTPPRAVLRGLLLDLFAPDELRRFLRDRWPGLEHDLPEYGGAPATFAEEVVRALERRGAIDELHRRLAAEVPGRAADVEACAACWRQVASFVLPTPELVVWRRLRAALAAGHATIRLIGFPHRGPKPAVSLQDACVPLRMRRGDSVVPWTVARLLKHLLARREQAARVVVLGDPGSGKSTLCQFLTVLLAGGVQMPAFEIPEVVPLYVRLRDAARCVDWLQYVSDRAGKLGAPVSVDALTRACEEGRAVLIVDGLDEVGDPAARIEERDRLLGFLGGFPRVPVLVSSREVGYGEAPLPERGAGAFLHLTMAPLDDEEIAEFAKRWYAAIEPNPAARDRGAADLVTSIGAAPAVRSLAGNRLLMTLIALLIRQDARLPGERVALLERCVQLFLDTWPALRGERFTSIPPERQRRLLETLAAGLVGRSRRYGRSDMTIGRDGLIAALAGYWRSDEPKVASEVTITAWIDHLSEASGLVPEVGPGVYQFVHRSLQEYLAACWYAREGDPASVLMANIGSTTNREVWRMLAGLHAADRGRATELFRRMSEGAGDRTEVWSFLLECLGEEADFPPDAVEAILERVLQVPESSPNPSTAEQAIARLSRFSGRHHTVVRWWFEHRLGGCPIADLLALVWAAAAVPFADAIAWLDARADRVQAAAMLAGDVWPRGGESPEERPELDAIGRWAWSALDVDAALGIVADGSLAAVDLIPAAMMLLQVGLAGPIVTAVTLQLAVDALALAEATAASPAWRGVAGIAVRPGGWVLPLPSAVRFSRVIEPKGGVHPIVNIARARRWVYTQGRFPVGIGDDGNAEPNAISDRFNGVRLFGYLVGPGDPVPDDFWTDACVPYGMDCFDEPDEFGDYEELMPGNDYPLKEFERDMVGDIEPAFSVQDVANVPPTRPPDECQAFGPYVVRARMIELREQGPAADASGDADLVTLAQELHALHAAHAVIAARTFAADRKAAERASELRQQSAWLLQNWHAVEQALSNDPPATVLALVLALGWTQCLTTGRWPDSPRWRALLGERPAHWWPRLHWHLCWSTARPEDDERRAAVLATLAEGMDDDELGELARRWSREVALR